MSKLKNLWCELFNHKMIQLKDDERICSRCKYKEKRIKLQQDDFNDSKYTKWMPERFIERMALKGDKVRLAFMAVGRSYWIVKESNEDMITFIHPVSGNQIKTCQEPSSYEILKRKKDEN